MVFAFLLAMAALLPVCRFEHGETLEPGEESNMWHLNSSGNFADPRMKPFSRNECTPVVDDPEFRGIVIDAPPQVEFRTGQRTPGSSAFALIRLCGICRFDYHFMGLDGDFIEAILIVAVDDETNETFSGKLTLVTNAEPQPPDLLGRDLVKQDYTGLVVEEHFNPNLAQALRLPARSAQYVVYATLGEYKSNSVRIRVSEAK